MKKELKKYLLFVLIGLVVLIILGGVILFLYCNTINQYNKSSQIINNDNKKSIDLYYRDTVSLSLNENIDTVICEYTNLVYREGKLYLKNPDSFDPAFIHSELYLLNDGDTTKLNVSLRSWINGRYSLAEVNPHDPHKSVFKESIKRKLGIESEFDEVLLLTKNDTSYLYSEGKLVVDTKNGRFVVCDNFRIKTPIYNQLIIEGDLGFFRTEHEIYISKDRLKSWKQIYQGPRAIRESMVFLKKDSSLLFSQYVPGTVRIRHYILKYNLHNERIDTVQTFYTLQEKHEKGLLPIARHTHVLSQDPYSQNIFVGNGDGDEEAGIFICDKETLKLRQLGGGSQPWRTLQFFFGEKYIFWDTDSDYPQYLTGINREKLNDTDIDESELIRIPLYNSACWCAVKCGDMYLLPSNSEGCLYDKKHRLYGILFDTDGYPVVYNLIEEESMKNAKGFIKYHQLFPIGVHRDGTIWVYDGTPGYIRKYRLIHSNM